MTDAQNEDNTYNNFLKNNKVDKEDDADIPAVSTAEEVFKEFKKIVYNAATHFNKELNLFQQYNDSFTTESVANKEVLAVKFMQFEPFKAIIPLLIR